VAEFKGVICKEHKYNRRYKKLQEAQDLLRAEAALVDVPALFWSWVVNKKEEGEGGREGEEEGGEGNPRPYLSCNIDGDDGTSSVCPQTYCTQIVQYGKKHIFKRHIWIFGAIKSKSYNTVKSIFLKGIFGYLEQ